MTFDQMIDRFLFLGDPASRQSIFDYLTYRTSDKVGTWVVSETVHVEGPGPGPAGELATQTVSAYRLDQPSTGRTARIEATEPKRKIRP